MDETTTSPAPSAPAEKQPEAKPRLLKRLWKKVRKPIARSVVARGILSNLIAFAVKFVYRTNRVVAGSDDVRSVIQAHRPAIGALWHGQHLMAPAVAPKGERMVALFSRSADAELNARVAEKLGFRVVRGSGGREDAAGAGKGGARALIALKKALDAGSNVAMIADIPHGTPREAGLGVVTLAKLSGRPIVPFAIATSRRKVLEKSWDKTTINLPFGRQALALGEPIHVPAGADAETMERKRREVTAALDAATARAYQMVDGQT